MSIEKVKQVAAHAAGRLMPALANVIIYQTANGNRAQAGDGRYWIDGPTDMPCMQVNAEKFLVSLNACNTEPNVSIGEHYITMSAGRIRTRLKRCDDEYPRVGPVPVADFHHSQLTEVLTKLIPYVATDASRPWATSICFSGDHAYATNNVVIARVPLTSHVPIPVNIPGGVVDAILKVGEITAVGINANSVTFYYGDGTWIRSGLIDGTWPTATADKLLDGNELHDWQPVHAEVGTLIATAEKVSAEKLPVIQFLEDGFKLVDEMFEANDLPVLPDTGRCIASVAALVLGRAKQVAWHTPKTDVHSFRDGDLVGVFGGSR
jgi:hypothetical protein